MMNKILLALILLVILTSSIQLQVEKLSISADVDFFISADSNYKVLYGKSNIIPRLKTTINLSKKIYLWSSYSKVSFSGETSSLKYPIKCKRMFLNFGAGLNLNLLKPMHFFLEGGGAFLEFEEESFEKVNRGSTLGLVIKGGIKIHIVKSLFIQLAGGYMIGKTQIENIDINLGGMILSGGLRVSF